MLRMLASALVIAMLSGCSTMVTHEEALTSLAGAASCCKAVSQFHYRQLAIGAATNVKIDDASDAFLFPTGKSYFVAFRLPANAIGHNITIQSYALGETIDNAHIFYPQADLLDEAFNIVSRSHPQDFTLGKAPLSQAAQKTWGLPVKLEGVITLDKPEIRYVVVYTTMELLNSRSPYETMRFSPIILPGIVGAIPLGKELITIPHSPFGLLYIVLDGNSH